MPEPPHTAVKGRRRKTHHSRKQVREEASRIPEERPLALDAPQLLEEREGQDLRVQELLEGFVASAARVETAIGVVYETEQHGDCVFQRGEGGSMLALGHPGFLSLRARMALFLPSVHATDI